jgi:hypothetical protein
MGYGLDSRGSNPGKGNIFFSYLSTRQALGSAQPPIKWVPEALFPCVKRPGRDTYHSPPSSAEVKNVGATSPFLLCLPSTVLV